MLRETKTQLIVYTKSVALQNARNFLKVLTLMGKRKHNSSFWKTRCCRKDWRGYWTSSDRILTRFLGLKICEVFSLCSSTRFAKNSAMLWAGESILLTMGLNEISFLCISGRPYRVRGFNSFGANFLYCWILKRRIKFFLNSWSQVIRNKFVWPMV